MTSDPLHVNDAGVIDTIGHEADADAKISTATQSIGGSPEVPPPAVPRRVSGTRRIWPLLVLCLLAVGTLLWLHQDRVLDWAALRNYQPPADIQKIANQDTFTPYAQRLFYVNRPSIEDKDTFNKNCPDASEEIAVLGCYVGDRRGIYIYNVTDVRLDGTIQVTAAHEMLHQAYDRLSSSERRKVNDLLTEYATTVTDKTLLKKLSDYQNLESTEVLNEEHSIFGTEASALPPQLEAYYKQYFTNRSQVVAYHQQQAAAFTERQDQINAYDAQLKTLKTQIDADRQQIVNAETQLKVDKVQMDGWLAAKQIDEYNQAVPQFNTAVAGYKQELSAFNDLVGQYNDILEKRGKIALQEEELQKAQDSQASSVVTKQ
jgi:hypothetical protein